MALNPKSVTQLRVEQAEKDYSAQLQRAASEERERVAKQSSLNASTNNAANRDAVVSNDGLANPLGIATNYGLALGSAALQQATNIIGTVPTALAEYKLNQGDITIDDLATYQSIKDKQQALDRGENVEYTDAEQQFMRPWVRDVDTQPVGRSVEQPRGGRARNARATGATPEQQAQVQAEQEAEFDPIAVDPSQEQMAPKLEILDNYFNDRERIGQLNEIGESLRGLVNTSVQDTAFQEGREAYANNVDQITTGFEKLRNDDLSGITDMVDGISGMSADGLYALFTNPQAVGQVITESVPAILTAARSMAVGAAAAGNNNFSDALDRFEEEYGRIPAGDERAKSQALSALSGLIASYSDRILAQGGALVPGAVERLTPRVVSGAVSEGIAESAEQAATEYAGAQDTERMQGSEVFVAGLFGFGSGGAISGAVSSAERAAQGAARISERGDAREQSRANVNSGTPEEIDGADVSSANGLGRILRNASTVIRNQEGNASTREEAVLLGKNVLNMLDARVANAEQTIEESQNIIDSEGVEPEIAQRARDIQREANTELRRLNRVRDSYQQEINNEFEALNNPETINAIKERLNPQEALDTLNESPEAFQARADRDAGVLASASITADNVTEEDLTTAAQSQAISPQRAVQLQETATLNQAIKSSQLVNNDIINGGRGFIGIREYQQRINDSLNANNLGFAERSLGMLQNFAMHAGAKADAYEAALQQVSTMPAGSRVEVEGFQTLQGEPVTIDANATRLVQQIRAEAGLINTAFGSLSRQVEAFRNPEGIAQGTAQSTPESATAEAETATAPEQATTTPVEETTSQESVQEPLEASPQTETEQTQATQEEVTEQTTEEVVDTTPELDITTVSDEDLLGAYQLQVGSRQDISTLDAEAELTNRGYVIDPETGTATAPVAVEGWHVADEVNQGSQAADASPNEQFLSQNPVTYAFDRRKRGVHDKVNILNVEEVTNELGRQLRPVESFVIRALGNFVSAFEPQLQGMFRSPEVVLANRKYQHVHTMEAFSQEDGTYSESFTRNLAISAFEYLETRASQMTAPSTDSMAIILGLDTNNFTPTVEQYNVLNNIGTPYNVMATNLGAIMLKNLGLRGKRDVGINLTNKMQTTLGRAGIEVLAKMGIFSIQSFTGAELNAIGARYSNTNAVIRSVSLNMDTLNNGLQNDAMELFGALDGFIESLTSVEREPRKAEIGTKTQKVSNVINRSGGQRAASKLVEGANKDAKVAHFIDANMNTVFDALGDDTIALMLGERDESRVIPALLPKVTGKNRTIRRDISTFRQFRNRMQEQVGNLNAPFYYNFQFGSQLRMNAIGSDINYQRSKLHRYLTAMEPTRVDPSNDNNRNYTIFKLGVAQGMGIDIDKQTLDVSLQKYEEMLTNPVVSSGVSALVSLLSGGEYSNEAILNAVAVGGEETHSLKSLVSLAELQMANGMPFDTTVTYEIDGITNGPFNAHIQMGLELINGQLSPVSIERMAQGGVFLDGTQSYSDWISNPSNLDIYQTTTSAVHEAEVGMVAGLSQSDAGRYSLLKKHVGELVVLDENRDVQSVTKVGRNLSKNPVTVTVYAAGQRSISDKIANGIMDNMVNSIQDALEEGNVDLANSIIADMSAISGVTAYSGNPYGFEMSPRSIIAFRAFVEDTLGDTVNSAIRSSFTKQVENTNRVTQASNLIHGMFMVQYENAVNSRLQELRDSGQLSRYEFLSQEELDNIRTQLLKVMPVFNTYYGDERNGVNVGGVENTNTIPSQWAGYFRIEKGLEGVGTTQSFMPTYTAPGASAMAMLNISGGDAATMARAAMKSSGNIGLNVYDARIARVSDVIYSSNALNTAAYEALTDYSILGSVSSRMTEAVNQFRTLPEELQATPAYEALLGQVVAMQDGFFMRNGTVMQAVEGSNPIPVSAQQLRSLMPHESLMNSLEYASWAIQEEYQANEQAKGILNRELVFNQFEALGTGVRYNNGKVAQRAQLTDEALTQAIQRAEERIIEATRTLEESEDIDTAIANAEMRVPANKPTNRVNPNANNSMVTAFNGRTSMPIEEFTESAQLAMNEREAAVYSALSQALAGRGVTLQVLTDPAGQDVATFSGTSNSKDLNGFYDPATSTIYLNGANMLNTGMQVETLLHEMVHAAVNSGIFAGLEAIRTGNQGDLSNAQMSAFRDIQSLYNRAVEQGITSENSLENLYEFVAWGLTNAADSQALGNQPSAIRTIITRLVNGIRQMLGMTQSETTMLLELLDASLVLSTYGMMSNQTATGGMKSSPQRAHDRVRRMNLLNIFDGLESLNNGRNHSAAHSEHLRTVLEEAVNNAIDPTLLATTDPYSDMAHEDAMLMSRLDPDIRLDMAGLTASRFNMSRQEAYVYSLYSHVIDAALNDFGWQTREVRRMYDHAKNTLTWEDFVDSSSLDTQEQINAAREVGQARYDAVFTSSNRRDYLRNFMALAVTNENFRDRLDNMSTPPAITRSLVGGSVRETIANMVSGLLNFLNDIVITRTHEPTVSRKLDALARNLRARQRQEQGVLMQALSRSIGFASNTFNRVNNYGKERIDWAIDNALSATRNRAIARGAIRLGSVILSERRADALAAGIDRVQALSARGREGFISSIWSELRGTNASNRRIHQLLAIKNKMIDQENVHIRQNIARLIRNEFVRPLTDTDKRALTKAVLKTDLSSLMDNGYTMNQIHGFMSNSASLRTELTNVSAQLRQQVSTELFNYFTNSAKALGRYMATGEVTVDGLNFNTDAIVSLHGTGRANPAVSQSVRNMVDTIATLEALRLTNSNYKRTAADVMATEMARSDGSSGMAFLFGLHRSNKANALANNFRNSEHNYQKGYTREIIDPYKSIQIAPASEMDTLASQGYTMIDRPIRKDANDPNKTPLFMFVSDFGGEATFLQGVLSTANKAAKGSSVIDAMAQAGNALPVHSQQEVIAAIAQRKQANRDSLFTTNPRLVMSPLVATTNVNGDVVDYRYLMNEEMKDSLLAKDNRVDEVMGAMVAGVTLKVNSEDINNQLIDALHEQYSEDAANRNLERYLLVEPNSKDPKLAEAWRLLPEEAKVRARTKFGREGVYVRNDLLNVAFGYRKWSIADLWNPNSQYPALIKNLAMRAVEGVHGQRVARYLVRGERGLQELVKELKDIVVIKSVVVMIGNLVSNTVQLPLLHGVSPVKAISDQITAFTAASEYRATAREIFDLQTRIDAGMGNAAMVQRINELSQNQQRNPVKPLMDAGMLQTIVDDAGEQDSIYSYRHSLASRLDSMTSIVPKGIKEGIKQVTLQQGSIGYDALSQATQLSDFAARYALFNHLTQNEGVGADEALSTITDAFINYDLPPHKAMQYMNDVGITWFFKYFIRIQKVIANGFRENPARVLAFAMGQNMLGVDIENPTNSFFPFVDISRKVGLIDGLDMAAGSHPIAQLY